MSTLAPVHTVVVRVWLPDRPGALGQVASRIGSVRGDVLAIEILEVGGGRVIDELVVALPDPTLVDLMVNEVHAIDGVSVEHVRGSTGHVDASLLSLSATAELAESPHDERVACFLDGVERLTEASWVMVAHDGEVIAARGDVPTPEWVTSLLAGSSHLGDPHATSSDMFWSDLPRSGMWVAAGREGRTVHDRERVRLDLFARIADALLVDVTVH